MSSQYPSLVMIIRHGEKPGNPADDSKGGPDLSVRGSARAAALPQLFTPDPAQSVVKGQKQLGCKVSAGKTAGFKGTYGSSGLDAGNPRFSYPAFLFATKKSSSSNRPVETITPLSQALKVAISSKHPDNKYAKLAGDILKGPATYGGKVVLICWHHGKIPDLAMAFGVPQSQLQPWSPWNPTVFDLVFQITWSSTGQANLAVGYQQLLYGDTM